MTWDTWKQRARQLKRDTLALYFACRDPRMPWYARLLAAGIVAYAFSPIDLIPDPIPVLGYLDDLVLLPLGIALVLKMIPPQVMIDSRARAALESQKPANWVAAGIIIAIWIALAALALALLWRIVQ